MTPDQKRILADALLAMADDELILGHRNAEWDAQAPLLEDGVSFAAISVDHIRHAMTWYTLHSQLVGENPDTYPHELVYHRPADAYRCAKIVALPKGTWSFTVLRQYLFTTLKKLRLMHLESSAYQPLADIAQKNLRETQNHLQYSQTWATQLGQGTKDDKHQAQSALNELMPYTAELFQSVPGAQALESVEILPETNILNQAWLYEVMTFLDRIGLDIPEAQMLPLDRAVQGEHTVQMLEKVQSSIPKNPAA